MSEILWLASYPKSGNTWLRMFLYNVFFPSEAPFDILNNSDLTFSESALHHFEAVAGQKVDARDFAAVHALRPRVQQALADKHPGTVFVKTHSAMAVIDGIPAISPAVTAGAIYIVRNPLDICISYAHHFGVDIDEAIGALNNPNNIVATASKQAAQIIGGWSEHVASWMTAPGLRRHVVRYEDLLHDTETTFQGIVDFLGLGSTKPELRRAIDHCSFGELRRQEDEKGFGEASPNASKFFREGRAEQWREVLSEAQIKAIVERNRQQMKPFGYLDGLNS